MIDIKKKSLDYVIIYECVYFKIYLGYFQTLYYKHIPIYFILCIVSWR